MNSALSLPGTGHAGASRLSSPGGDGSSSVVQPTQPNSRRLLAEDLRRRADTAIESSKVPHEQSRATSPAVPARTPAAVRPVRPALDPAAHTFSPTRQLLSNSNLTLQDVLDIDSWTSGKQLSSRVRELRLLLQPQRL